MKKVLSIILIVLTLVCVNTTYTSSAFAMSSPKNLKDERCLYHLSTIEFGSEPTSTVLLSLPVAKYSDCDSISRSNSIAYVPDEEYEGNFIDSNGKASIVYAGPESFCFDDEGNVCILDTYSKRICVYDLTVKEQINEITIPDAGLITDVVYLDGLFYVLDVSNNCIISTNGYESIKYDLPPAEEMVYDEDADAFITYHHDLGLLVNALVIDNNQLVIDADIYGVYRLIDGNIMAASPAFELEKSDSNYVIERDGYRWEIPSTALGITIQGSDEEGNLYLYCSELLLDSNGYLCGDDTLRIYDRSSKLVSAASVNACERDILPTHSIRKGPNDEFYELRCYNDCIFIEKIDMQTDFTIVEIAFGKTSTEPINSVNMQTRRTTNYLPANTWVQAESLMKQYKNLTWTIHSCNQNEPTGVDMPNYTANALDGATLQSVPYAYGRSDTIEEFTDHIDHEYCAGNVNSTDDPNCAGVDCSGYATHVYDVHKVSNNHDIYHLGSYYFDKEFGYAVTSELTSEDDVMDAAALASKMDCWAAKGRHVMIHMSFSTSGNYVYVYEAMSTNAIGKVTYRGWLASKMKKQTGDDPKQGFRLIRPWHSGEHVYIGVYSHDDQYHWKTCSNSNCLARNYTPHTYEPYGLKFRCTICGHISDVAVYPMITASRAVGERNLSCYNDRTERQYKKGLKEMKTSTVFAICTFDKKE